MKRETLVSPVEGAGAARRRPGRVAARLRVRKTAGELRRGRVFTSSERWTGSAISLPQVGSSDTAELTSASLLTGPKGAQSRRGRLPAAHARKLR